MYSIKMSEKQLIVMREALEFYSRFLSGQVTYLPDAFYKWLYENDKTSKVSYEIRDALLLFKRCAFDLEDNESYGVGSKETPPEVDISYEMYRKVFEYFAQKEKEKNPNKHWSVYDNPSGVKYTEEPFIEIEEK